MKRELVTTYSESLGKNMSIRIYGEGGWPLIAFQPQDAMSDCFEDFGMVDSIADSIDAGQVQVFSLDSADAEGWSDKGGDNNWRTNVIESYYHYVCDEVVPFVAKRNGTGRRPILVGCGLGATHALVGLLRRPDLFQGCIALSGNYDAQFFFGDWMNTTLYLNSPVHFLPNTPKDHPYIDLYNKRQIVLCSGQGAWEEESLRTERILDDTFRSLGVDVWCDYWGYDVDRDWSWWQKQLKYFLPFVLEDAEKTTAEEREEEKKAVSQQAPAAAPKEEAAAEKKPAAKKTAAKTKAAAEKKPAAKKAAPKTKATTKKTEEKKPAAAKKPAATTAKKSAPKTKAAPEKAAEKKPAAAEKKTAATAPKAAEKKTATATPKPEPKPAAKPTPAAAPKAEAATEKKPAATKPATAAPKAEPKPVAKPAASAPKPEAKPATEPEQKGKSATK